MNSDPLVTIVIPSYNHAQYITNAIESVLNQTYENIELIVVDDGSKDNSHEIIRKFSDHPKVKIILNKENKGQSAVFNQALAISSGKYVALLPSDDWFLPEKTALQVAKMEACDKQVGVVYAAGARFFEDTGETYEIQLPVHTGWIARELLEWGNFIYPITPLYRRTVLEQIRPNEELIAEGEAIHLRIALKYKYEYVDEIVAVMRDHSYNIGKDTETMQGQLISFSKWYFSLPDLPDELRMLEKKRWMRIYRILAMKQIFDMDKPAQGRKSIGHALHLDPLIFMSHPKLFLAYLVSWLPLNFRKRLKRSRPAVYGNKLDL